MHDLFYDFGIENQKLINISNYLINTCPLHITETHLDVNKRIEKVTIPRSITFNNEELILKQFLQSILHPDISEINIYVNQPSTTYHLHRDVFAKCRINMLIVEHDPLFKTEFLYNDKFIELPYRKNMLTALNVTVPHRVFNEHQTKVRYLLNIGYHNITYKDLVKYMVDNHC